MTARFYWTACGIPAVAYPAYSLFGLLVNGAQGATTHSLINISLWCGCSAALGARAIVEGLR